MNLLRCVGIGVTTALFHYGPALADDITGAGSTFVSPILSKWSATYSASRGAALAYQPIGSGGGIAGLKSETVDFAASDAPLKPTELQRFGLLQFPLVIGGIVPVINVDGVKAGELKFTGSLLADIFMGKVTKWNDPKIANLNPGVRLPASAIIVAHRVEGRERRSIGPTIFRRPAPNGAVTLARACRSRGRSASVAKATKASPPSCSKPRTQSAMSSMLMLCEASCRMGWCRTKLASSCYPA